ncbi:MAG TPA: DUF5703 domain-containing protein [Candidatus Hydrogenedentes bacterium]|nr:DUF5703 domain-containing protein [Candidatus Hydrogenedentota bacterium]
MKTLQHLFLVTPLAAGALFAAAQQAPTGDFVDAGAVSYNVAKNQWLFDPARIVSRNDVIYTGPAYNIWKSMPVGGGDLSAMVRCDGDLNVHLSKCDNLNGSLGHVRLDVGERGKELARKFFHQRLDLYRGKVAAQIGDEKSGPRFEVWGHPSRRIIVIDVFDPQAMLGPVSVEFSEWRSSMNVGQTATTAWAKEVSQNGIGGSETGMQHFFTPKTDPMLGRGTGVVVGTPSFAPESISVKDKVATMTLPGKRPGEYSIIISAEVTLKTDPLEAANAQLAEALAKPMATLRAEHEAWWKDYWSKSFLRLHSADQQAEWLTAAYHVHLYTLACVNRGPFPASYGGGGLLIEGDARDGSKVEDWVQEVRFNFMPLYAANRLEMAKGLPDAFSRMVPFLEKQTQNVFGWDGIWVPETYAPWGMSSTLSITDDNAPENAAWFHSAERNVTYGRFSHFATHVGLIFTSGLEISHHYLAYYRYSGDEEYLRRQAYPFVRGVCEFICGLVRKEADGRYHLDPANALETWWQVRDPADTFDGIRAIFPQFIELSERYGKDARLRAKCREVLAALPEHSIGKWHDDGRVDATVDAYAPAAAKHGFPNRINCENPALYRVYPFGLSGIGAPDYDRAVRTFTYRTTPLWWGWSMDAIWAARLGLKDQACVLLAEHARRFNTWPYGGWEVIHCRPVPRDNSFAPPFLDGGGCSATALQEILMQSHGGVIRVVPALSALWGGVFQLRAEGGFLVAADVTDGVSKLVEIRSLWGGKCRIENPWNGPCNVIKDKETIFRSDQKTLEFDTVTEGIYLLEFADKPAASYQPQPLEERYSEARGYAAHGLPGRHD